MMTGPDKPCAVPTALTLSGLFACRAANNCTCPSTNTLSDTLLVADLEAFEAANRGTLSIDNIDTTAITTGDEDRAIVARYWKYLVEAYRELYRRTGCRFHSCSLHVRIGAPPSTGCCCIKTINCQCGGQTGYRIDRLRPALEGAEYAQMVTYTTAGADVDPVDLPWRAPVTGARWRVSSSDGDLLLSGQRRTPTDTAPSLPPQDRGLPAGAEGTSALVITYDRDLDPAFVSAVYHSALLDADRCTSACQCGIAENVTSASDDGWTIQTNQGGGTPNTSIALQWRSLGFSGVDEIDEVLTRYRPEERTAEFASFMCGDRNDYVIDMFWSTNTGIGLGLNNPASNGAVQDLQLVGDQLVLTGDATPVDVNDLPIVLLDSAGNPRT